MEVNELQEASGHPLSFSAQATQALMRVGGNLPKTRMKWSQGNVGAELRAE